MRYECCPNDPEHYATGIRVDERLKKLIWESANGQDSLIIQTPYGVSAADELDKICQALNAHGENLSEYTEIMDGVWALYVSALDKAKNNGCIMHGEASSYSVFGIYTSGDTRKIYETSSQAMFQTSVDIPLEIRAFINKETIKKGLFKKHEEDSGYYAIVFPDRNANGYIDGSICYAIDNFRIPITAKMIENEYFYVQTEIPPVLVPVSRGIKIVQ